MVIWRMRNACWKPKATNTHLQYVILITFPLQQWLHERVSMLTLHVHRLPCSLLGQAVHNRSEGKEKRSKTKHKR